MKTEAEMGVMWPRAKEVEKLRSNVRYAEALGLFSELKREALGSFEQRGKMVICF